MFEVRAVEPQLDGTEDSFDPSVAADMKLPFESGWDHWGVFQNGHKVGRFDNHELAARTCSALNNLVVLNAAA